MFPVLQESDNDNSTLASYVVHTSSVELLIYTTDSKESDNLFLFFFGIDTERGMRYGA